MIPECIKCCFRKQEIRPKNPQSDVFCGRYPCVCVQEYCDDMYENGIHKETRALSPLSDQRVMNYYLSVPQPYHYTINNVIYCKKTEERKNEMD